MHNEHQPDSSQPVRPVLTQSVSDNKQRRRVRARRFWRGISRLFGLVLLVIGTALASSYFTAQYFITTQNKQTSTPQVETVVVSDAVAVVDQISESVVSVVVERTGFGIFGQPVVSTGAGSGVILTSDGYILTNNHVIEGADTVGIVTNDDQEFEATVIATEPEADLALLKATDATGMTAARIGDSNAVRPGQDVFAIGNALGRYPNSVTKGIISGLGRPIVASGLRGDLQSFEDLIQTDTAINQGNSGGPLVNVTGEVIGINTAVAGQAQNIGFSVPINRAMELIDQIPEATTENQQEES
mgnify:CR=1 FL=1|jgi:S1-C subfamily serine protease